MSQAQKIHLFWQWIRRLIPTLMTMVMGLSGLLFVVAPKLLTQDGFEHVMLDQIATEDIRAPKTIDIVDERATLWLQEKAQKEVLSVYDKNTDIPLVIQKKIQRAFGLLTPVRMDKNLKRPRAFYRLQQNKQASVYYDDFLRTLNISLPQDDFIELFQEFSDAPIDQILVQFFDALYTHDIIADKSLLKPDLDKGILVRSWHVLTPQIQEEIITHDFSNMIDLHEARLFLVRFLSQQALGRHALVRIIQLLAERLIEPNMSLNRADTEARQTQAREHIQPVMIRVVQGEPIIKKGDRFDARVLLILKSFEQSAKHQQKHMRGLGIFLLLAVFSLSSLRFARRLSAQLLSFKDGIFVVCVVVLQMLITRVGYFALSFWQPSFPIPYDALLLALPFALGALLIRLFLSFEMGLVLGLVSSVVVSFIFDSNPLVFFLYVLSGSLVAATPSIKPLHLWRTALEIFVAQCVIAVCGLLLLAKNPLAAWYWVIPASFVSACMSVLLCALITPLLEVILDKTTDLKLKELANLNHPLLKQMIVSAPGTYHHSIIVAQLAEEAAYAIRAHALLAKVGAYFHDIGKIEYASLYLENIQQNHTILKEEDVQKIRNHVLHGQKFAKTQRLGREIYDIISSHHGCSWVLQSASVQDKIRYNGPLPKSKEAALIMLADAVESRMKKQDIKRQQEVFRAIDDVFLSFYKDGQLSACELTLKDLDLIKGAFARIILKLSKQPADNDTHDT